MFVHAPTARSRSLVKAITWRAVGSTDTFIVGLVVALLFHHTLRHAASIAISISSIETVTKVILFYFHERVWARVQWGRADKVLEAARSGDPA
ncbi:MAG TPA: DUF2061 domain-containing protein [Caulobacteraceae bacterium]